MMHDMYGYLIVLLTVLESGCKFAAPVQPAQNVGYGQDAVSGKTQISPYPTGPTGGIPRSSVSTPGFPSGVASSSGTGLGQSEGTIGGANNGDFQEYVQGSNLNSQLSLNSPTPGRIYQRQNSPLTLLAITPSFLPNGTAYMRVRSLDANSGAPLGNWIDAQKQPNGTNQSWSVNLGGGWFKLEVIVYDSQKRILARMVTDPLGIGEIFVVAGQSNSTNCGATPIRVQSGYVFSTDGSRWQIANDPQIGTNDYSICQGGSSWPAAGDRLVQALRVPVAFASTGYSGTSLSEWLPGQSAQRLYEFTLARMRQFGPKGFRAVLWHQGENDVKDETPQSTYYSNMKSMIESFQRDANWQMPWLVAEAAWCRQIETYNKPQFEQPILAAQRQLAAQLSYVYSGPNTDLFTEAYRGTNCHFNQQGSIASGQAWADKIIEFLRTQGVTGA